MSNSKKEAQVEQALDFLRTNLVGEVFPTKYQSIVGSFVLESSLRPGQALEDLTLTLLKRRFKSTRIQHEPKGRETFPDILVGFGGANDLFFEVKCTTGSGSKIKLASELKLLETTLRGDPVYWQTTYLLWTVKEEASRITVDGLSAGRIWEVSGQERGVASIVGDGAGRTRYLVRGKGFANPMEFRSGLIKSYEKNNLDAKKLAKFSAASLEIVKGL